MTKSTKNVTRVAGGKFAPGHSGNPAGKQPAKPKSVQALPKEFAETYGEFVLSSLLNHVANNATIALEVADRMFGPSNWGGGESLSSLLGPMETAEQCEDALNRVLSSYYNGLMTIPQCLRFKGLIAARKAEIAGEQPPASDDAGSAPGAAA